MPGPEGPQGFVLPLAPARDTTVRASPAVPRGSGPAAQQGGGARWTGPTDPDAPRHRHHDLWLGRRGDRAAQWTAFGVYESLGKATAKG